jgi:NTP pyrophosphatase (non-canonical NTP hydrolase)
MELPYDAITLCSLQEQVKSAEIRKGHIDDDIYVKNLILVEEFGELAKALRIHLRMRTHGNTARHNLEDEFGDVLYLVISIANRTGINLAKSLLCKIAKDEQKVYKVDGENI